MKIQYFKTGYIVSFLSSALWFSALANAQESNARLIELVSTAIERLESTPRSKLSYKISSYENEEGDISSKVERFDPRQPDESHWQLISLNGEKPTTKQQKSYLKERNEPTKEEHSISIRLSELIQVDTLVLLQESDLELITGFNVNTESLGINAKDELKGEIRYDKSENYIEEIRIINKAPFSPMFSAEIDSLEVIFQFNLVGDWVVIQKQAFTMKGTFAFFSEIDEVSIAQYSDYQTVL